MATTATFYTFAKRHNSTAVPSGSGVALDVNLKDPTSLITPTLLVSYAGTPTWSSMLFRGRYYFITNITSVRSGLWEISAAVDVLATYKSNILATSAFVIYDTDANTELIDGRLPIKTTDTVSSNNATFSPYFSQLGTYIMTVLNRNGCETYFLTAAQLTNIMDELVGWINGELPSPTDIIDAIINVGKFLIGSGNVMSNIKGVTWVPFDLSSFADGNAMIKIGLFEGTRSAAHLGGGYQTFSWTQRISIPWQFTDWRKNEPYTQLYVYIPYLGSVSIPAGNLISDTALDVQISINKITGAMAAEIHGATSGEIVYVGSGSTGIAVPLGVSSISAASAVTGGLTAAAAIAAGQAPVAIAAAALNTVKSNPQNTGGIAGGAGGGLNNNIIVTTVCHDTSEAPGAQSAVSGTPSFATKTLSALSGYVQTTGASVSGSMTETEREEINTLLDGGIYIE